MKPNDIVFLSASVPYREPWTENAHGTEIEEAIVCLARAVFARKGRLLFGGHPSVSPLIASVAGEYFKADPARTVRPVITFQSEFFRKGLPNETWLLHRMGWSTIEWTEKRPATVKKLERDTSLEWMREWMLLGPNLPHEVAKRNRLTPPVAMVAIGGMEGVIEEAQMFVEHRERWRGVRPEVYALKSGGAAAAVLAADRSVKYVDLEELWEASPGRQALPETLPMMPYAAMLQFMLDDLVGE